MHTRSSHPPCLLRATSQAIEPSARAQCTAARGGARGAGRGARRADDGNGGGGPFPPSRRPPPTSRARRARTFCREQTHRLRIVRPRARGGGVCARKLGQSAFDTPSTSPVTSPGFLTIHILLLLFCTSQARPDLLRPSARPRASIVGRCVLSPEPYPRSRVCGPRKCRGLRVCSAKRWAMGVCRSRLRHAGTLHGRGRVVCSPRALCALCAPSTAHALRGGSFLPARFRTRHFCQHCRHRRRADPAAVGRTAYAVPQPKSSGLRRSPASAAVHRRYTPSCIPSAVCIHSDWCAH